MWNTVPFQGGEHILHLQIGNNRENTSDHDESHSRKLQLGMQHNESISITLKYTFRCKP